MKIGSHTFGGVEVRSVVMEEELTAYILARLHEALTAIVETEQRIGDDPQNDDAQRSLARSEKAVTSALKRLEPNIAEGEDE
ncbi:MAG: hypothetical protein ACHQFZ_04570 [Acidimicrobiales bacterium]